MNFVARSLLLVLGTALVSCGGVSLPLEQEPVNLLFGNLEVSAAKPRFAYQVKQRLEAINGGGWGTSRLQLDEQHTTAVASLTGDGAVAKLRLRYVLKYEFRGPSGQGINGQHQVEQVIDVDQEHHLANLAAQEHFFHNAQVDSINNLVTDIRFQFINP